MTCTLKSAVAIRDLVYVDADDSIVAVVTALLWRGESHAPQAEISWFHNGALHTQWIEVWRLTNAEGKT